MAPRSMLTKHDLAQSVPPPAAGVPPRVAFRAAIFDLDGTLVDSTATLVGATNHALEQLGFPAFPLETVRPMLGGGTRKLMERALAAALPGTAGPDPLLLDRACALKLEFEQSHAGQSAKLPFAGAHEMLRALQRAGVQLAVLSNTAEASVRKLVTRHFPDVAFAHVAGARDDTPLKPHPFAALRIAQTYMAGVKPADCVFVGDSEFDMKTALAAGMKPVAVPWGIRPQSLLVAHGAAVVAKSFSEINSFVAGKVSS